MGVRGPGSYCHAAVGGGGRDSSSVRVRGRGRETRSAGGGGAAGGSTEGAGRHRGPVLGWEVRAGNACAGEGLSGRGAGVLREVREPPGPGRLPARRV